MKYREVASKVEEQVRALEQLEGYPKRPERIGAAFIAAGLVPAAYVPGAIGWTDKLVIPTDVGNGELECNIPDEIVDKHEGKTVNVRGKPVKIEVRRPNQQPDKAPNK